MNTPAMTDLKKKHALESFRFVLDQDELLIALADFLRTEKYTFYCSRAGKQQGGTSNETV